MLFPWNRVSESDSRKLRHDSIDECDAMVSSWVNLYTEDKFRRDLASFKTTPQLVLRVSTPGVRSDDTC